MLGFRLTCYYYRGAYYRAFWRSPSACAVREPHAKYSGETKLPLIAFNLHRFFFYMAIVIAILNTYDMVQAFRGPNGSFGIGLGSLIITVNVVLLWGVHAVLPLLQAHHRRAAEELLQAPGLRGHSVYLVPRKILAHDIALRGNGHGFLPDAQISVRSYSSIDHTSPNSLLATRYSPSTSPSHPPAKAGPPKD